MEDFHMIGTYFWYYCICKREVWLIAHAIESDQQNEYIQMGKVIHETTYLRDRKEIDFGHSKFDVISSEDGKLVIGEIKKSSSFLESAKTQLLFYLKELYDSDIEAEGVLLFPDEKKREVVILDENNLRKIEQIKKDIYAIINSELPPKPVSSKYCKKCAYSEFCWS